MEIIIKDRSFIEATNVVNSLQFFSDGMSLIEVRFDKQRNPILMYKDGAAYWAGLPADVEEELKKHIKKAYPNGFVTREISSKPNKEWLERVIKIINENEKEKIDMLEESGEMIVEESKAPKYTAKIEICGYVDDAIIFANQASNSITIFRRFVKRDDYNMNLENAIKLLNTIEGPTITKLDKENQIAFTDSYIIAKRYQLNMFWELQKDWTSIRNDRHGFPFCDEIGKFLPLGGTTYSMH